ncbi:hypothetical protein GOP47_0020514 [Adiantum capillus-veneris]|uniref:GRPD C-terminal domain-containing protein n=1 Tax=Adiantum capillus-veneris TaxID=13818 RepID=A0A9D4U992_ADICA|nr:hypothetical protein GOP47_0020514 [Adiantum capillus-veneris]
MAISLDKEELPRSDKGIVELSMVQEVSISIDLLATAKHFLSFLKTISGLPHLHGGSLAIQAIRRYLNCWMPLVAKSGLHSETTLMPPLDVQWVWLCHRLRPKSYLCYCKTHYGELIGGPIFLELSSQDAALQRSRELWNESYSSEPFEMEPLPKHGQSNRKSQASQLSRTSPVEEKELMESVSSQIAFYKQVSQQYLQQDKFLTVAKERYICFLHMLRRVEGRTACIPTCDIQLMWKCHQTAPAGYVHDTQLFLGNRSDDESAIQQQLSNTTRQDFEQTSRTWELLFGRPYERAGAVWSEVSNVDETMPLDPLLKRIPLTINWHHQSFDLNARHGFLQPRYVLEVCVHIKSAARREQSQKRADQLFLRMQMVDACRNFKHHVSVEKYRHDTVWHKLWSMQCEASTKGIVVDLIANVSACLVAPIFSKKVLGQVTVSWNELEKEPLLESAKSLTMKKSSHVSDTLVVLTSITPPVQAPYLLKALLDRVTDNTGAMISKKVLRLNKNEPQEGRWITRTVLDHAGRECFIIRMRFATGVWRRKIEGPVGVDWNERIIHIHGGGWNYISGSTGIAPEQVLATATPLDDEREQYKMKWSFSTGETLTIQMPIENLEWERHLRFSLKGNRLGVTIA